MNQALAAALVSLLVMVLGSVGATVWSLRDRLHVHEVEMARLTKKVDQLERRIDRLDEPPRYFAPR